MPFNFLTMQHYQVNYESLFSEINSQIILNDKQIQYEYIQTWINVLKDCDNTISKQLSTKESIMQCKCQYKSVQKVEYKNVQFSA